VLFSLLKLFGVCLSTSTLRSLVVSKKRHDDLKKKIEKKTKIDERCARKSDHVGPKQTRRRRFRKTIMKKSRVTEIAGPADRCAHRADRVEPKAPARDRQAQSTPIGAF
jgi:glycerol-3-phosphate O-acyltransferase